MIGFLLCETRGENCHVSDVNVYLGEQRDVEIFHVVSVSWLELDCFLTIENICIQCIPSIRDTPPNCLPTQVC